MNRRNFIIKNQLEIFYSISKRNSTENSKELLIAHETIKKLKEIQKLNEQIIKCRQIKNQINNIVNQRKLSQEEIDLSQKNKINLKNFKNKIKELENTIDDTIFPNLISKEISTSNFQVIREHGVFENKKGLNHQSFFIKHNKKFFHAKNMTSAGFVCLDDYFAKLHSLVENICLYNNTNNNFIELNLPLMLNEKSFSSSGHFPKFKHDVFQCDKNKFLIPTSEVSILNFLSDEKINNLDKPIRFTCLTPCFRKEAGSNCTFNKGMVRLHQFYKVEVFSICKPENSEKEHQFLLNHIENLLKKFNIPYRVICLPSWDISHISYKTYDIEVWLPISKIFLEISSCSNCLEYQSILANIKFKNNNKLFYPHTLNGSCLPIGRLLIALVENHQDKNGNLNLSFLENEIKKNFKDYIEKFNFKL